GVHLRPDRGGPLVGPAALTMNPDDVVVPRAGSKCGASGSSGSVSPGPLLLLHEWRLTGAWLDGSPQTTPSALSRSRSSAPSDSHSLYTSALCWPRSGAGWISVGEPESCTGLAGMVNSPQPGCWIVVTMPRALRCGSDRISVGVRQAPAGTPAAPSWAITSCLVRVIVHFSTSALTSSLCA